MPRGIMLKHDILARVYKLKTAIYENGSIYHNFSEEKKSGAHAALNQVLDILQEYRD